MDNDMDCGEALLQAFRCLDRDYVLSSPGSERDPVWEAFGRQSLAGAGGRSAILNVMVDA
jgi:hypothetical protein